MHDSSCVFQPTPLAFRIEKNNILPYQFTSSIASIVSTSMIAEYLLQKDFTPNHDNLK